VVCDTSAAMRFRPASFATLPLIAAFAAPAAAQTVPAPAAASTGSGGTAIELTSLRLMREKHLISDAEYESAMKELAESSGGRAADGNTVVVGKWATTLYGFVEADSIWDSTQSFAETQGNALVATPGSYAGDHDRAQFSVRNSRFGMRLKAPETNGIRTSAQLEMDFLGTQLPIGSGPGTGSEAAFYVNPTFRVRHMNLKVETPYVDVLFGQYWQLFGWQSLYHPNTVQIQGVPGEIYSRTPQLRLMKTFKSDAVTVELAVAAMRPPQRDSAAPEGQAGIRFAVNKWTGLTTNGSTGTSIQPLSIAVTGDLKHVRVPHFEANTDSSAAKNSSAIAVDAFVPVLTATKDRRGNALALNGEFATGYGTSDLYTSLTGGASFPALKNPTNAATPPTPTPAFPNIDNGIVNYDANGILHFIQWQSYEFGMQYYFPGLDGRAWLSANYAHLSSVNIDRFGGDPKKLLSELDWFDFNLFGDVTPSVRLGLEYANTNDKYVSGLHAINHRVQFSGFYIF
jgi:hypothetical protein